MLCRVANSIYWMNRYLERADSVARFVDVNLQVVLDLPTRRKIAWEPLIAATGDLAAFRGKHDSANRDAVLHFLTFDLHNENSLITCVTRARDNARSVRDVISEELWQAVNQLYFHVQDAAKSEHEALRVPHDFFHPVKRSVHECLGIGYVTMSHDEGWHFGRLGRLLERADKTSRIVDVKAELFAAATPQTRREDEIEWAALLKSASAFEMYRKCCGPFVSSMVVDFLLFNPQFPRSLFYCLQEARRSIKAIGSSPLAAEPSNPAERAMAELCARLEASEVGSVLTTGLHRFLDDFQAELNRVDDAVRSTFFEI